MRKPLRVAAIGELLWDLLPDGPQLEQNQGGSGPEPHHSSRRDQRGAATLGETGGNMEFPGFALGGAPANFAAILAQMFACDAAKPAGEVFLVSCVGDDPLGIQARQQLLAHGVRPDFIAVDPNRPTGTVEVQLDAERGPRYRICSPVAWDAVGKTPQLAALPPTLDAICFGTLAQRSPVTRTTLRSLVAATRPGCLRVFDVNLREPDWTAEAVLWGCAHATIFKMNHEEVAHIANAIGAEEQQSPLQIAHSLLDQFSIQLVAITRGPHGSLLVTRNSVNDHPGIPAHVVDSIGAGDCFSAALTYFSLQHRPLPILAEAANRWGAWAASQRGGMPFLDVASRTYLEAVVESAGGGI